MSSLTRAETFWDVVSVWLSIAVAIGVAMEAVTEFDKLASLLRLETQARYKLRHDIAKAGLLILILALAFEVVAAIRTHAINAQIIFDLNSQITATQKREQTLIDQTTVLQAKNDELQHAVSKQEGTLNSLAQRTDSFDKRATALSARIATTIARLNTEENGLEAAHQEALASSSKAASAAAIATKAAGDMNTTLTAERAMQESMRELITPRVLTPEQLAALKERTRAYRNTSFDFTVTDDIDARNLMLQLGTVLLDSGWVWKPAPKLPGFTENLSNGYTAAEYATDGISIEFAESQRSQFEQPALAIVNGLSDARIKAAARYQPEATTHPGFDKQTLHLIIGKR